tara:strand:- start:1718 stop:2194 length:477 start_codon:yes stop_codon:yes gene_type:complete
MGNMTTKVIESLTLNGEKIHRVVTKTIGVASLFRRTVAVPSGVDTTVAVFKSTVGVADGALDIDKVKYIRITNLSATGVTVNLSFQIDSGEDDTDADESFVIQLNDNNSTFIMGSPHDSVACFDGNASIIETLHDLESIIADSASSNATIEVFIASAA